MDIFRKGSRRGMANGNSSCGERSDLVVCGIYCYPVLPAQRRDPRQQRVDEELVGVQCDIIEHASTIADNPGRYSKRAEKMKWSWWRKLFSHSLEADRTIEKSVEIRRRLDEEMFRLKATLDGEENWFRQEGHRNDRKSS